MILYVCERLVRFYRSHQKVVITKVSLVLTTYYSFINHFQLDL